MQNDKKIIRSEIKKLITKYIEDKLFMLLDGETKINPSQINNGFCRAFAFDLVNNLAVHNIIGTYQEVNYKGTPHAFVKIGEKYYDSECVNGVKNWKHFPIFREYNSILLWFISWLLWLISWI
jgi:hypothetical protein